MSRITILLFSLLMLYGCGGPVPGGTWGSGYTSSSLENWSSNYVSDYGRDLSSCPLNEELKYMTFGSCFYTTDCGRKICKAQAKGLTKVASTVVSDYGRDLSSCPLNEELKYMTFGSCFYTTDCGRKICKAQAKGLTKVASTVVASSISNQYVCQRATKSDGSSFESLSSSFGNYVQEARSRGFNLESCNQLTGRGNSQTITQTVQVPKTKVDKIAPVLDVEDRITVTERNYTISGKVSDDSTVFVEVDGISIPIKKNKFTFKGASSIGIKKYKVIAFDQWGNETIKNIIVERVIQSAKQTNDFETLNPNKIKSKNKKNRIALIIGIEEYENISDANYAKRDAELFIDYAQTAFGVPQNNIKYFFNENAQETVKFEIRDWLKKTVRKNTEVYVYFSGHGMALNNGQDLYLLTNDTRTQYIKETALNRNEIFNDIAQYNPKSVTAFLDTCYSGAGRADGEILLAMAKGLVVVDEQQQQLPDNFTLFTAASAQESAWSLPEAQHGTFSYFLMKGMEGEADLNDDNKLTNGELQEYLLDNVSRYAQQQQTPQMIGDPDQVLVRF